MNNTNTFVTTSLKITADLEEQGIRIAEELGIPYIPRDDKSLLFLEDKYNSNGILVVSKDKLSVYINAKEFFYHPGMAKLRIKGIKSGNNDQMITAMNLLPGDSVLDCTLGLGSDAVVANYITGPYGSVVGLESNPLLAYVVKEHSCKEIK